MRPALLGAIAKPATAVPAIPYRFFRLTATAWFANGSGPSHAPGSTGVVRIAEWEIYDATNTKFPTSVMTTNSAPSPLVASARSVLSGGFEAFHAFDGNPSDATRYISDATTTGTEWLQIDLGSGNTAAAKYFKIAPDAAVTTPASNYMVDFHIDGSMTGAFAGEETRVLTRTGLGPGAWTPSTLMRFDAP